MAYISKPNRKKIGIMGDSDESIFWDEREENYGGVFSSQDFQTNHPFQTADQYFHDQDFGSKRVRLSPEYDHQEGDGESSSPLGLRLKKTPSFLNLLQKSLCKGKESEQNQRKMEDLGCEKLKASNFPALYLKIGSWERVSRHEGDLTAKLYFAKRKLVWEMLDGALKSKIEIQWCDISAIRAVITPQDEPGTLEIEVNQPPLFYREINPQPRKHTLWQQASDFTGGQAPIWRRHYVRFPPGVLDKHLENLLQCDQRLHALTQKPFPSHQSPYFDPTMFGVSQLSLIFGSNYHYPDQTMPLPAMDFSKQLVSQPYEANWREIDHHCSGEGMPTYTYTYTDTQTTNVNDQTCNNNPDITGSDAVYPQTQHVNWGEDEHQFQINIMSSSMPESYYFQPHNPTTGGFF